MVILILIVLGLCFGSFVNALVWRLHKQEEGKNIKHQAMSFKNVIPKLWFRLKKQDNTYSITTGRSMCTNCHHELAAQDLVPVLSYIWLRGKCRYCGKAIQDTPLPELLTPILFVISYLCWPYSLIGISSGVGLFIFVLWLIFLVGFVALSLYDFKWYILPNRVVYPLIGLAIAQVIVAATLYGGGWDTIVNALLGVAMGSGIFYILFQISDGTWIGGGDVKLGVVLGLLVGGPTHALLLIFIASLLGTVVALPLLVLKKATRTSHLPFGPYLMLAAVIVVLFGHRLVDWYTTALVG